MRLNNTEDILILINSLLEAIEPEIMTYEQLNNVSLAICHARRENRRFTNRIDHLDRYQHQLFDNLCRFTHSRIIPIEGQIDIYGNEIEA